jgi:HPt (histidine-containing phosphotransfer) domain-containing protein
MKKYNINIEQISIKLEFDIEDVQMLIDLFIHSAKKNLSVMDTAIKHHDMVNIKKSAHSIKGSSANLHLEDISTLAKKIEQNSSNFNNIDYNTLYNKLSNMIDTIYDIHP